MSTPNTQADTPPLAATLIQHDGKQCVRLNLSDGSFAVVLLHGAQVVSWQAAGHGEQLYLSPQSHVAPGQAVRGGVPVIFPQFEQRGPDRSLPRHGLVRTRAWQLDQLRAKDSTPGDHAIASFTLTDDDETRALWPHDFSLEFTVHLAAGRLDMELHISNTGDTPWPFSAALHTYLAVSDVAQARVQGLQGCRFIDSVTGDEHVDGLAEMSFADEIDRIYAQVPRSVLLRDGPRRLTVESEGFDDLVLWNPGPQKCHALKDMPNDDWQRMLCVEAAQIMQPPELQPGESWTARQSLVLPD